MVITTQRALEEINPCGIESRPETYCQYATQCAVIGREEGGFVCLAQSAYQTAGFLLGGSDVEGERKGLGPYLSQGVSNKFKLLDPESWDPQPINQSDVEVAVNTIVERAENLFGRAQVKRNAEDPLNFLTGTDAIIKDING